MLRVITDNISIQTSDFCFSNAVIMSGETGVLLIDPGITQREIDQIAHDLAATDRQVVAGFSTHPHWDHLLWDAKLGTVPRYGTAMCAQAIANVLQNPAWRDRVNGMLPPEYADQIPLNNEFGKITGLAGDAISIPWDGPAVRVIEHNAHAKGHAALLVESDRVLIAGDMLSDVLIPILDGMAEDPIADYLSALDLLAGIATDVDQVIPGHGSVGDAQELRRRIEQDRAYVIALRDGKEVNDVRIGPDAKLSFAADVHERQLMRAAAQR